jgi:hypothetical protein
MAALPPELDDDAEPGRVRRVTILGREFVMPQSRLVRVCIGGLFVFFGLFGFLPILGFWMIPVGLLILSYEFAMIRRWRRRFAVRWGRRNGRPARDEEEA